MIAPISLALLLQHPPVPPAQDKRFAEAADFVQGVHACQGVTGNWAAWKRAATTRGWMLASDHDTGQFRQTRFERRGVTITGSRVSPGARLGAPGSRCEVSASARTEADADAMVALVARQVAPNDKGRTTATLPAGERMSVFRGHRNQFGTPVAASVYADPPTLSPRSR